MDTTQLGKLYFLKRIAGQDKLAIVSPIDEAKFVGWGWQQITAEQYAQTPNGDCVKLDLRSAL